MLIVILKIGKWETLGGFGKGYINKEVFLLSAENDYDLGGDTLIDE